MEGAQTASGEFSSEEDRLILGARSAGREDENKKPLAFLLQHYGVREIEGILDKVSNFTFVHIHMLVTTSKFYSPPPFLIIKNNIFRRKFQGEK